MAKMCLFPGVLLPSSPNVVMLRNVVKTIMSTTDAGPVLARLVNGPPGTKDKISRGMSRLEIPLIQPSLTVPRCVALVLFRIRFLVAKLNRPAISILISVVTSAANKSALTARKSTPFNRDVPRRWVIVSRTEVKINGTMTTRSSRIQLPLMTPNYRIELPSIRSLELQTARRVRLKIIFTIRFISIPPVRSYRPRWARVSVNSSIMNIMTPVTNGKPTFASSTPPPSLSCSSYSAGVRPIESRVGLHT